MAKVTVTFEDQGLDEDGKTGDVQVNVDFEPALTDEASTPAQNLALTTLTILNQVAEAQAAALGQGVLATVERPKLFVPDQINGEDLPTT